MEIATKESPDESKSKNLNIKPEKLDLENNLYEYMNIIEEIEEESEYESEEEAGKEQSLKNINISSKESYYKKQENEKPKEEENKKLRKINLFFNNTNEIYENKIEKKTEDSFIFDGKLFKKNIKLSNYMRKDNIKRNIYKCEYNRHEEKLRQELKKKSFCNATIEYILPNQKIKSKYILKEGHSEECEAQFIKLEKKELINTLTKEQFISECEMVMNSSSIYDRGLFKAKFLELYNNNKFNFPINNNLLSNIITKWKNTTNKFNKSTVWDNMYDYQNRLILREFRSIFKQTEPNIKIKSLEYIIWGNEENIKRIRKAKHYYIDGTFHHPKEFKQLLILMYKDVITNLKIPGIYILTNGRSQDLYEAIFFSLINLLTNDRNIELEVQSIITDTEKALINIIKKYFPNIQRIACFFHYKQDILRNLKSYGLYKENNKTTSEYILKKLGNLPFIYKGDTNKIMDSLINIKNEYPKYTNFIDE